MFALAGRLAILLVFLVAGVLLSGGCTEGKADKTSPAASQTPMSDLGPASPGANRQSLTSQELLWLDTVEQLLPTMNKAFDDFPTYINTPTALPAALRSLANDARGCSRELARLGAPSARLQSVGTLVRQGCREYDKAATCLEEAARLGTSTSSPQVQKREQLVTCGFAAAEVGRMPLAEAQMKVIEIRAGASASR